MGENIELIRPTSQNYGATGNYNATMKDGLQVDFVLVYKNPKEDDPPSMEEEDRFDKRVTFEQNLERTGLILEHVQGKFSGVRISKIYFWFVPSFVLLTSKN